MGWYAMLKWVLQVEFESEFERIKELANGSVVVKIDDIVECPTNEVMDVIEEISIETIMRPLEPISESIKPTSTSQGKVRVPRKMV